MTASSSLLILVRTSPYGGHQARAALDAALTAAAFEVPVAMVFLDDGVLQLLADQDTTQSQEKNIGKIIPALALYDVDQVYVHSPSIAAVGLGTDTLLGPFTALDDSGLAELMHTAHQVLVF